MVSIPRLADFDTVLKIYYENIEIGQRTIRELFRPDRGKVISNATARKLFLEAEKKEIEQGVPKWSSHRVNTRVAFEAWGIDITEIERRKKKIDRLFKQEPERKEVTV